MRKRRDITNEILSLLKKNQKEVLSTNQTAELLNVHWSVVFGNLNKLLKKGLVKQISTSNGFYWRLKEGGEQ